MAAGPCLHVRLLDLHLRRTRALVRRTLDARERGRDVESLELGTAEVDPCREKIRGDTDRSLQECLRLTVVLGSKGNECEQAQGFDVPRILNEDLAVNLLRFFQATGAMVRRRLGDSLASRIGAQERLHQLARLIAAT